MSSSLGRCDRRGRWLELGCRLEDKVCVGGWRGETGQSGAALPAPPGAQEGGGLGRRHQHRPKKKGSLARPRNKKGRLSGMPSEQPGTTYHGQYSENFLRCLEVTSLYE